MTKQIPAALMGTALIAAAVVSTGVLAEQGYQTGGEHPMGEHSMSGSSGDGTMGDRAAVPGTSMGTQAGISVDALDDQAVVNRTGDQIGEVEEIVRRKESRELEAVVEVDTLMGLGDKEVVIPLSELSMKGGKLVAPDSLGSKDDLKQRAEYDESQYDELAEEEQIERSDFAAFEATPDAMR